MRMQFSLFAVLYQMVLVAFSAWMATQMAWKEQADGSSVFDRGDLVTGFIGSLAVFEFFFLVYWIRERRLEKQGKGN